jgi:PKD repeat protein
MPDGSIVLMGGSIDNNLVPPVYKNDVWQLMYNGGSWSPRTTNAPWLPRAWATSVVLPDGSIILMGGSGPSGFSYNDVWMSKDSGATWKLQTASAPWPGRRAHTSTMMSNGNIVLMGGAIAKGSFNDVWHVSFAGSTAQNPTHTYAKPGTYPVALAVCNAGGCDRTARDITVSTVIADFTGTPRSGIAPLTVQFTDTSTGTLTSRVWDFGDGTTSTEQNPTHTYTGPQTYRVNLTVSDGISQNTVSRKDYVTVMAWKTLFGGSEVDFGDVSIQTQDGGLLVVGKTRSHDGDIPPKKFPEALEVVVAKFKEGGSLEWNYTYGGSNGQRTNAALEVKDGYLIVGTTSSNDGDVSGNHGSNDVWVLKIDKSGNLLWEHCYGGKKDDEGTGVVVEHDSSENEYYVITGWTTSNDGDVSGNHGSNDVWVFKIDKSGNLLWQQCYGGAGDDKAYHIEESNDPTNWIIAGATQSNDGDLAGKKIHSGDDDVWIFSIPREGSTHPINPVFNRVFGGSYYDVALATQRAPAVGGGGMLLQDLRSQMMEMSPIITEMPGLMIYGYLKSPMMEAWNGREVLEEPKTMLALL